jgi:hypothetical protein
MTGAAVLVTKKEDYFDLLRVLSAFAAGIGFG